MFIGTGDLVVRYVDPTGSSLCISKVLAISLTLARVLLKPDIWHCEDFGEVMPEEGS